MEVFDVFTAATAKPVDNIYSRLGNFNGAFFSEVGVRAGKGALGADNHRSSKCCSSSWCA
jgi:hypothetical protein